MKLEVYTHGVKITGYTPEQFNLFRPYLKKLTLMEAINIPGTRRVQMEESKRYYGLTEDEKQLFIHKECLEDFLEHLEECNISNKDVKIIPVIVPKGAKVEYELFEKYILRDYQEDIIEDFEKELHSHRVDLFTGYGKDIRNGTPIKTPFGWTPIESLQVNDLVIGQNGLATKVTGIYPQGISELLKVTFEDGRTIKAGPEHLWSVMVDNVEHIIDTKTIQSMLAKAMVSIPTIIPTPAHKQEQLSQLQAQLGLKLEYNKDHYIPLERINDLDQTMSAFRSLSGKAKVEGKVLIASVLNTHLQVVSVEPTDDAESTCISVDSPDKLYVAKDYIVTHNTLTSLAGLARFKTKLVVMIPPKYFGLWTKALDETFKSIQTRYMTVSGSKALKDLIDKAKADELKGTDIFLISNTTYRTFIESYEKTNGKVEELGYNCTPLDFHRVLKAGCQINDEIQEDPGLLFRIDLFTNVNKQIYLSATPFTGNSYVTRMINKMLPEETKVRLPDYNAFINCLGLIYTELGIKPNDYVTPYKNTYNHARYETRMLKSEARTSRYYRMVKKIVDGLYIKDRQPEQKIMLLCSTVNFIKLLVDYLKDQYPDLNVTEYVSGTPYENLLENDIIVSTIKSAGTGVDIPNLREVVLLQATDSKKDNIQILGRTRPLKLYPDVTPRLTYLICENIPHHVRYHRNKTGHFKGRVKNLALKRISI